MKIGYACLNLSLPARSNHRCVLKNATPDKLRALISKNLQGLKAILEYNIRHGILLYRITSDIIPFASHEVNQLDWQREFTGDLQDIKQMIKTSSMTVSMHPGQYTVINSPRPEVVENAVRELEYHCSFLDCITETFHHKIVLHVGGAYGDKKSALKNFTNVCRDLPDNIKHRLIIENDDRIFHIADVLEIHSQTGLPVVFDYFHHRVNPPDTQPHDIWINPILRSWRPEDGTPKMHYSDQFPFRNRGYHALQVNMADFFDFIFSLEDKTVNIMLESKDKNLSAERALHILSNHRDTLAHELNKCTELLYCRGLHPDDTKYFLQLYENDYREFFIHINKLMKCAPIPERVVHTLLHFASLLPTPEKIQVEELLKVNDMNKAACTLYQAALTHGIKEIADSNFFFYPVSILALHK